MRRYMLAATALAAIGTPALAKDGSGYVGIEGGVMFPKHQTIFANIDFTDPTFTDFPRTDVGSVSYKTGWDVDVIGGYDFGMFRLEGELGYKRAKTKSLNVNSAFLNALNTGAGTAFTTSTNFGLNDKTSVYSAMLNGLVDFGGQTGIGGYVGAGAGYANVHQFNGSKGKFAWQLLAGLYMPVSDNIDVGLKYRYFRAGTVRGTQNFAFTPASTCATAEVVCSGGTAFFDTDSRFSSHSVLLSLVYNFGAAAPPPPPPPPPPPAPATQTCPDGSVIPATSTCPAPPPPPPPPPTERGERGR